MNDENDEKRNYTVYTNGTWLVYRRCTVPSVYVNCVNGNWSEDIDCPYSVTTDIVMDSPSQDIATTDTQYQDIHDTTRSMLEITQSQ